MAQVTWSRQATNHLAELRKFLRRESPPAAMRAGQSILAGVRQLRQFPASGKPAEDSIAGMRDLIVPFGSGGYVVRYMLEGDHVTITAIRHTKQAGF